MLTSLARFFILIFIFVSPLTVLAEALAVPPSKQVTSTETDSKQVAVPEKDKTQELKSPPKESVLEQSPKIKPFQDKALENIQAIAQTGALHLALLNLDTLQVTYNDNPMRWLKWERERTRLLNLTGQYAVLVERLSGLPNGLSGSFLYWVKTQQASAYLKLQEYSKARQVLSSVIWANQKPDSEFTNRWLPHWRRMIIHSYLNERLVKDAHIAITRFRQDYGQGDINDIILYARVLLMNNLADEALNLLSAYTSHPEAGMLHLLAQLRRDTRSPRKVLQAGLRQMQGEWVQPELKIYLWSIVAEAAQRSDDRLSAIKAMEFVLSDASGHKLPEGLFKLTIDNLWDAYLDNAMTIGNKAQYLMGDDVVWLNAAQAIEAVRPVNARSLYALLILRGQDKSVKKQAAKLFLKSLMGNSQENDNSSELIKQLFLTSDKFKSKDLIPVGIRHFLVDELLRKGNIRLASELMASIKTSPQGADKFMWSLRRARILVMGGNAKGSAQALTQLLSSQQQRSGEDIDKLMQVVFDLQTVNAHQYAYEVFSLILQQVDDIKLKREIYYWMADSKKAQQQYADAASLYLKSALLPEGEGLDPWGQTARYQAANNLAKAGLLDDARALYSQLLKTTKEESRRKVLKHELQQLRLLENKSKAVQQ
ncbi:hypothetical protein MNBD_GAMMA23-1105 [hydrothermal vent metagenome]|uniref:Uncharacterized protein n=1 Tax=hydrothermal vent metagenome TaxID=652676 RepID=A0A3B0ZKR3_9ZZZZ